MRSSTSMVAAVALGLVLMSCGSSASEDATIDATTTSQAPSPNTGAGESPDTTAVPEVEENSGVEVTEEPWVEIFPEIALAPTEPGPRPTLAWRAVEGAALYQLTILDADGNVYWSWSGTENSVPLGGMSNPDAMGAWVFEELSWLVVARDADSAPVGMSRRASLLPS